MYSQSSALCARDVLNVKSAGSGDPSATPNSSDITTQITRLRLFCFNTDKIEVAVFGTRQQLAKIKLDEIELLDNRVKVSCNVN